MHIMWAYTTLYKILYFIRFYISSVISTFDCFPLDVMFMNMVFNYEININLRIS